MAAQPSHRERPSQHLSDNAVDRRSRYRALSGEVHRGPRGLRGAGGALALPSQLEPLFPLGGLHRGSTVVVLDGGGQGATSLALSLCAAPTRTGLWVGVLNASRIGFVSAAELGVALDRLVVFPRLVANVGHVASALMEACAVVLLGTDRPIGSRDAERLQRRAREHRCVLLVLSSTGGSYTHAMAAPYRGRWPEAPDTTIEVTKSAGVGIEHGAGRFLQRRMQVAVTHRRGSTPRSMHDLVLPDVVMPETFEREGRSSSVRMDRVG